MSAFAAVLCFAGFLCLCGSMKRHQKQLLGRRIDRTPSLRLRVVGFTLLAIALGIDLVVISLERGAIYWFGQMTVGALATVATLELRQRASTRRT